MESNEKMQNAKKEFDQIAENETANFKITLLEKHLMESREAHLELKQQELELRDISDRKLRKVLRDLDAQVAALPDTEGAADATDVGGSDVGVTGGAGALM